MDAMVTINEYGALKLPSAFLKALDLKDKKTKLKLTLNPKKRSIKVITFDEWLDDVGGMLKSDVNFKTDKELEDAIEQAAITETLKKHKLK